MGWHFDNASFAVTLLVQASNKGGDFEYVKNTRNNNKGEQGYEMIQDILNGDYPVSILELGEGDLILFMGCGIFFIG